MMRRCRPRRSPALVAVVVSALASSACAGGTASPAAEPASSSPAPAPESFAGLTVVDDGDPGLPVTVIDATGTEVTVTSTERIFPANGDLAEVVFALGLALGACGGDDGNDSAGPPTDQSEITTTAPAQETTTTAPPQDEEEAIAVGADPEVDAVVTAWTTVFDSTAPVDDKVAFLQDAEAVRPTLEVYATGGQQVGGIALEPTAVNIEDDGATITYGVLFAGTEAYGDQTGGVVRSDGTWVVTREQFCAFMASACTPCP